MTGFFLPAFCRSKLTAAMVPAVLVALDALPLLPSGKVNKKALPPPPEEGEGEGEYVPPRDEVRIAGAVAASGQPWLQQR